MSEEIDREGATQRNAHIPANTKHTYHVTSRDLPLSCPMPDMELWLSLIHISEPTRPTT